MAAFLSEHRDWLDRHAEEWVEAGLVSDAQATAICDYEHDAERAVRLPIVAEVAAYLGSVLALMAGSIVVGRSWEQLTVVGRTALGVMIAVVGFVGGAWLVRMDEPGSRRLGSSLWVLAAGGVGLAAAVIGEHAGLHANSRDGSLLLAIGLPVLAVGVGLWRNLDRPLQLLTALAGAGITLAGLAQELDLETWQIGLVVWLSGLALGTLAYTGFLESRTFTMTVATAVAAFGGMSMMDWNDKVAPALAATTAALAVVVGTRERLVPVLVVGVLALLLAIEALLSTTFSGAGSSMVVAVIGLFVVAVAVYHA